MGSITYLSRFSDSVIRTKFCAFAVAFGGRRCVARLSAGRRQFAELARNQWERADENSHARPRNESRKGKREDKMKPENGRIS